MHNYISSFICSFYTCRYDNEIIDTRDCFFRHMLLHHPQIPLFSFPNLTSPAFSYDVSNYTSEEGVLKAFVNGCRHLRSLPSLLLLASIDLRFQL